MSDERVVHCGSHGPRRPAFVCQHLVGGTSGLGFYAPDDPGDDLQGWCGACEKVRERCGGWNDESEHVAGIRLICDLCYEAARQRNEAFPRF
jgi:hypothetical protein